MSVVIELLGTIGEPSHEGTLPNERPDMLVAITARIVFENHFINGLHGLTCRALGLSPGGVTQRLGDLRNYFDDCPTISI